MATDKRGGAVQQTGLLPLFRHCFLSCALLLVFFAFPLDFAFRFSSLWLSLKWLELGSVAGCVLLAYVAFSFLVACAATILLAPVAVRGERGHRVAAGCAGYLTSFLLLYVLIRGSREWFLVTFEYQLPVRILVVTAVVWSAMLLIFRRRVSAKAAELAAAIRVPLAVVSVLALLVALYGVLESREVGEANAGTKGGATAEGRPNIILISCDALSAKDMSLYGYRLKTTPLLDRFGRECYVFDNAIAAANWTRPCVASLLYGVYPSRHRLFNTGVGNITPAIDSGTSLPAQLKKSGYRTAAFVTNWEYAAPLTNNTYRYFDESREPVRLGNFPTLHTRFRYLCYRVAQTAGSPLLQNTGEWIAEAALGLMNSFDSLLPQGLQPCPPELVFDAMRGYLDKREASGDKAPFFMWGHVMPPHAPYVTAKEFDNTFLPAGEISTFPAQSSYFGSYKGKAKQREIDRLRLKYDESVLSTDRQLGVFLDYLRGKGYLDNSVVLITADHGESFSHGYVTHGGDTLYNEVVKIPLLVRLPGQKTGERFTGAVSQLDIYPTLLRLAGVSCPDGRQGTDLLAGGDTQDRTICSMALDGNPVRGELRKGAVAAIQGGQKFVLGLKDKTAELYDFYRDQDEGVDLARAGHAEFESLYRRVAPVLNR